MQRVELLVWRDFVDLVRSKPRWKLMEYAAALGITNEVAFEFMTYYRRMFKVKKEAEPLREYKHLRKPLPVDEMQVDDEIYIDVEDMQEASKLAISYHARAKTFRRDGISQFSLSIKTVDGVMTVKRIS